MVAPLTPNWYLDLGLCEVALKLNFEVRAVDLAFTCYGFDKSALDSLETLFEWYHQLIVLDIVDDVLGTIVHNDEDCASISNHVLVLFAYLHYLDCILRPICVQQHCEVDHFIVPLFVIGGVSQLQVLDFPILIDSIESKLGQVVSQNSIRIVHTETSQLNLSFWRILRIYRG